jgi:hypothetical protein
MRGHGVFLRTGVLFGILLGVWLFFLAPQNEYPTGHPDDSFWLLCADEAAAGDDFAFSFFIRHADMLVPALGRVAEGGSPRYPSIPGMTPDWIQSRLADRPDPILIRANALGILAQLGTNSAPAVSSMTRCLRDEVLSGNAAAALEAVGPAASGAIPDLMAAVDQNNILAAHVLGKIGKTATVALPGLRNLAWRESSSARIQIVNRIIQSIIDPAAIRDEEHAKPLESKKRKQQLERVRELLLAQRLVENQGGAVGKVQGTGVWIEHRNAQPVIGVGLKQSARQAGGFTAEHQKIAGTIGNIRVTPRAARFDKPNVRSSGNLPRKGLPVGPCSPFHVPPIVHAGPLQRLVIELESQGLDQMKARSGRGTQARDIAGVRRDFWLEKNHVHVTVSVSSGVPAAFLAARNLDESRFFLDLK